MSMPSVSGKPRSRSLAVPGRTTDQILDILLDNARRHGRGTVEVTLRDVEAALALDATDEGAVLPSARTLFDRGTTTGPGQGIGLPLAAGLAEAAGGRLSLAQAEPTRSTLLLPRES
ncbi:ATP-binding protein [Streptomyces sp. CB02959]|uniref:ATP-binding protein n=1 Tax=Streptomyces sp. CB02959 TaxID=2020330 RepID=UPI0015E0C8B4|nr:ATP-binding protein [Streptomyces sp. CB02959]